MIVAIARVMVMALAFYILFTTTKPQSLVRILEKIGVPYKYSYGFILALRFISIIADDLIEILAIQRIRGLAYGKNFVSRLKNYLAVFVPLTISTLTRVDEITISLEVKGFGYSSKRTYLQTESFTILDIIFIILCISIPITITYLDTWLFLNILQLLQHF